MNTWIKRLGITVGVLVLTCGLAFVALSVTSQQIGMSGKQVYSYDSATGFARMEVVVNSITGLVDAAGDSLIDAVNNALRVTLGTLISGEDQTATGANASGVMVVEFRYLNSGSKVADFQVKATPGFVHNMVCIGTDASATAGTIIVYDNTAESGTALFTFTTVTLANYSLQPLVFPIDAPAATGIYLGYTTVADVSCNVSYR